VLLLTLRISNHSHRALRDLRSLRYPPGHGDLYRSLAQSGLLDQLIAAGKEYLFISNIDNLGAVVDPKILSYFHETKDCEFIMEVTDKTRADVKGGTLIECVMLA
jgi:UTP--glucose-1-phosphate uridylyltransferase